MTSSLYLFALSSSLKTRFCVLCNLVANFFFLSDGPPILLHNFALLSYIGFAQFRKFDLKFKTEIIIRSKCWNFSFCGEFFFFSCSFRLSLVTDIKLDCVKFTEEILENIAIATTIPKSQVLIYPRSLWISKDRETQKHKKFSNSKR